MTIEADRLAQAVQTAPASHLEAALALLLELRQHDPSGSLPAASAGDLARSVSARLLDDAGRWSSVLGPCFDVDGVRELLGSAGQPISKQAVSQRAGLLALPTGSGRVVYPAFQFDGRSAIAGLSAVLRVLPETSVSRWTVASWLVSVEPALGESPIDALRSGRSTEVVALATSWAEQLG